LRGLGKGIGPFGADSVLLKDKYQTPLGKLTRGTNYGNYAIENEILRDNDIFIEDKTPFAEFMLYIKYESNYYGFWVDYKKGLIYVNNQYDPSSYNSYCITKDDHQPNLLLIRNISKCKPIERIIFAFQNGLLRFSNMEVKNQFYEFIHYFVR
jgi:hypothetical protein